MRIRLPIELKDQIKAGASANRRTMNAEIVARLERSFQEGADAMVPHFVTGNRVDGLTEELETLRQEVRQLTIRFGTLEQKVAAQ